MIRNGKKFVNKVHAFVASELIKASESLDQTVKGENSIWMLKLSTSNNFLAVKMANANYKGPEKTNIAKSYSIRIGQNPKTFPNIAETVLQYFVCGEQSTFKSIQYREDGMLCTVSFDREDNLKLLCIWITSMDLKNLEITTINLLEKAPRKSDSVKAFEETTLPLIKIKAETNQGKDKTDTPFQKIKRS